MTRYTTPLIFVALFAWAAEPALAATTVFFSPSQVAEEVSSGVTSDTISSNGYLFTYTRDKLFTGGTGQIIGRQVRVPWPDGVEAQAVTTPPPGVTDHKARITLQRVDGDIFDLTAFTARLLANTAGAGGAIEIMPLLNGEDGFNDPIQFDVSGYYGQSFSYDESPNPWGSTALLKGFDTYRIALYVDFAFTALTLRGAPIVVPIPGDLDGDGFVGITDLNIVLGNWNLSVPPGDTLADPSGDGFVGIEDLNHMLGNWNAGTPPTTGTSGAAPEPTAITILTLGGMTLLRRRAIEIDK